MILDLKGNTLYGVTIVLTHNDVIKNGNLGDCTVISATNKVDLCKALVNVHWVNCEFTHNYDTDIRLVEELATGAYSIQEIASMLGMTFSAVQSIFRDDMTNFNTRRACYKLERTLGQDLAIAKDSEGSSVAHACAARHVDPGGYYKRLAKYKAYNMWPGEDNG